MDGDFGRRLTLCRPLRRPRLSGKKRQALISPPSAGLSTAHLHIDGKSMGSLQCAVNITNDQFKLAELLKEAAGSEAKQGRKKVPVQPPRGGEDAHTGQTTWTAQGLRTLSHRLSS